MARKWSFWAAVAALASACLFAASCLYRTETLQAGGGKTDYNEFSWTLREFADRIFFEPAFRLSEMLSISDEYICGVIAAAILTSLTMALLAANLICRLKKRKVQKQG